MKCRQCGAEIPNGELFCPVCHAEVQLVPDYNSVEYLLSQRKQKDELKTEQEKEKEPEKKKHSALKAVLITLLVIVLAALAAWGVRLYIDNRNLNSYDYQIQHAETAYNAGNYADAASFAAQALSLNPQSAEAEYLTAEILMAQENYDRAIPILQDLIAKNQNDADTYGLLIKAYENKDDTASIKKLMDSANEDIRSQYAAYIASEPVFDPAEGDYTDLISITISADNETVYYTTDGTDPTLQSLKYQGPVAAAEGRTEIRAMAVNAKGIQSNTVIAVYNVTLPPPDAASISPTSGNYVTGTKITVTFPAGCKAYYAFDAVANTKGTEYTGPVEMLAGTHVFSVIVQDANGKTSTPASETYIVESKAADTSSSSSKTSSVKSSASSAADSTAGTSSSAASVSDDSTESNTDSTAAQ
ncbi:MAG: chitobiase/beta-hexosaminidase C-terminal domain-containing protein [Lachnospiraceae bacterium]|jgi:tetratricopeptide (TPR) repeat protein|nr:chitobiase/beta-hexosaminidase C-terminal domain-containing protein [Lachnospiraceae bacterium]